MKKSLNPESNKELLFEQFEFWSKKAIHSPEWEHLKDVFEKHKQYCEKQVHIYVRKREWDEVSKWQAWADQISHIFRLIDKRIGEVNKEVKKGKET